MHTMQHSEEVASNDSDIDEGLLEDAQEMLTVAKLQQLTGFDDLELVSSTELKVDATVQQLSVVGECMPGLEQLRLTQSTIPTLRDLGTRLTRLQVLWVNNCAITDCSGIQHCHQLKELYISFNKLNTLAPLQGLMNLTILDAEANLVSSYEELEVIRGLEELTELTLTGNPVCLVTPPGLDNNLPTATASTGATKRQKYRSYVTTLAPHLQTLDDVAVSSNSGGGDTGATPAGPAEDPYEDMDADLAAELEALNECVKSTAGIGVASLVEEQHRTLYSRGSTSAAGARRLPTANGVASGGRLNDHQGSAASAAAPSSAPTIGSPSKRPQRSKVHSSEDHTGHSSALTSISSGTFTGSAIRNLRNRRKQQPSGSGSTSTPTGGGMCTTPSGSFEGDGSEGTPRGGTSQFVPPPDPSLNGSCAPSTATPPRASTASSSDVARLTPTPPKPSGTDEQTVGSSPPQDGTTAPPPALSLFEQYKEKYGYTASGANDTLTASAETNAAVTQASAQKENVPTTARKTQLSTSELVGAVKKQKMMDANKVQETMLQDAMFAGGGGVTSQSGGASDAVSGGGDGQFESLSLNDLGPDCGDAL